MTQDVHSPYDPLLQILGSGVPGINPLTGAAFKSPASGALPAALGQGTMAASTGVVIASDQTAIPVNQTQLNGVAAAVNAGTNSAGVQRVTIATDQGKITSQLPAALGSQADASSLSITPSATALFNVNLDEVAGSGYSLGPTTGSGSFSVVGSIDVPLYVSTGGGAAQLPLATAKSPIPAGETTFAIKSASFLSLVAAAATTDFFTLTTDATTPGKVFVQKIRISAVATGAGVVPVQVVRRSAVNTTGTSTTATNNSWYPGSTTATDPAVKGYTANPGGLGTLVSLVDAQNLTYGIAGTGTAPVLEFDFTVGGSLPGYKMNTANQVLALNLNGATVVGLTLCCTIIWQQTN